ncbi:MAG: glycogen debranching enzyme GlgX [Actinobacteria bacterium HGW-Actinobacteria-2]|nr:MAG: glycogen debranching enzyme GlgX [Actinobacteria bacterium HGW-Actinobacteria-2]
MSASVRPTPPDGAVLGAHVGDGGTTFSLWAPRATRVELALIDDAGTQANHDLALDEGGVWRVFVAHVEPGQRYGFRVDGKWDPPSGQRFNPARLLLDPYARAITGGVDYSGPLTDHTADSNYEPDPTDSAGSVPLSVVVANSAPPTPLTHPLPLSEMTVYETHVRGFTRSHPAVPEHLRGTYAGLAYPAVIEYLVDLGVNAVELLPVHHFVSEPFIVGRGLVNYWGYNSLGFFAPHAPYSASGSHGEQVSEFKAMVSALHEAGIAVILDVVYNHTGEGGHEGPTLCFRGIDHAAYYRLTDDQRNDYDVTGCGNAVDTANPAVLKLVLDSLRYWITEMGVDGFRFDLATTLIRDARHHVDQQHPFKQAIAADPVLADKVMIAEPWDMGPYGYQVGRWGAGWTEWNDRFRGFTRDFWRGATGGVQELATRLSGSSDIFDHSGRPVLASLNFITAHDGFTLRDLTTYNLKHNEANAERNRDGADDNRSDNHGYEGETDDPVINAARQRTARNMMATLLLSAGVPMITAGDEFGRTQGGNNNAYCQDSPLSWVNWNITDGWEHQLELTRSLLALRRAQPLLRPEQWRRHGEVTGPDGHSLGRSPVAWFTELGVEMTTDAWHDSGRRTLGLYLSDATTGLLAVFHAGSAPIEVSLPGAPWAEGYQLITHTGEPHELPRKRLSPGATVEVPARTVAVFAADVRTSAIRVPVSPESPQDPEV